MPDLDDLIKFYALIPHPEGGFYRETYRAGLDLADLPPDFSGPRSASTAIYYLLPEGAHSAFHRIKSDEVWHFYKGGPLKIIELDPETGKLKETILGNRPENGECFQHVVPAGHWFGAMPLPGTAYAFVGCTVAPGFDFNDFELANRVDFLDKYPNATPWNILLPDR